MTVRPYTPADLDTLARWWCAHEWTPMTAAFLPATGLIVDECCAGFIYKTDSAFCVLEFVISDPSVPHERRAAALTVLIDELIESAKTMGFKAVHTSVKHPSLLKKYVDKHGFKRADEQMTNMVRIL